MIGDECDKGIMPTKIELTLEQSQQGVSNDVLVSIEGLKNEKEISYALSDHNAEEVNNTSSGNCPKKNSKEGVSNSVCSGHFKTSMVPYTGGSILSLMDELVKDPNSFHKSNAIVSDYFIMIRGVWRQTGNDLLIISIYAPHDLKDKQVLSDYLNYEIGKWKEEVVIMGDFNEVRYKSDTFGSVFNVQGANVFYSFITNAGLEEVPLGGSSFTWCHKSATKICKLYRFHISGNLLNTCSNITAITLERYLSDHRPILLHESHIDYGLTTFRFFHHWIEMEGFSKVVEDAWREGPCDESNAMINMMIKLKYLKTNIREWNKKNMLSAKNVKAKYKDELEALEAIIDKGDGNVEAKVKWSIEGDENTSFFHGMLNKKWSLLNIRGIMVDGMWIKSPNRLKGEFFHHFSIRFDKPDARRAHIEMRYPKTLTCDQQVDLESDVSNEEIKRAVWDCGIDKSSGPDGFTFGFYRRFWNLIENDVYDAVNYFFTYGVIPKGCNSSFIALIPKIPDANTVKDFRPISLIGSLYKIIAKILANRLVGILGDIVNECKWNQSCLRYSRGSIIINGSPTKEFQFFKGLKQGDPLSPFLFILIIESLHLSFQWMVDAGIFKGIKLSSSLSISHMFYADDAVFVGQWYDGNITTLVHVLECFYQASGLRVNMSKSKIMGVLVDSDKVKCVASKLGCLILKTPFSYLGSKVGGSMSRVHTWNEVVDRVNNRLSKWKMKSLSIGGRLTLLKSVLGSMPIFHMSIFRAPLTVFRTLESIRSQFFKGQELNSKKASWVNWKKMLAPKQKGGLGVSSLYALNRGLMFKWIWRFYTQNTSLWVRVIKAIHGDDGKVGGYVKDGAKSCWLSIVNEINSLKTKGINLLDFMHVKLENGGKTAFWEDIWIEGKALKNRVPRGGVEPEQFDELSALVHDVTLTPMSDRWIWALESSGDFSVAPVRKVIDDKSLLEVDSKTRWIKYVPIKVNVYTWKVKTDSLPTRFNVSRRGDHNNTQQNTRLSLDMIGDECDKRIMSTKIELTLEQSQQGVSNDVLVETKEEIRDLTTIKGVEDTTTKVETSTALDKGTDSVVKTETAGQAGKAPQITSIKEVAFSPKNPKMLKEIKEQRSGKVIKNNVSRPPQNPQDGVVEEVIYESEEEGEDGIPTKMLNTNDFPKRTARIEDVPVPQALVEPQKKFQKQEAHNMMRCGKFLYDQGDFGPLREADTTVVLADLTLKLPQGILLDVIVKVENFNYLVDFLVLDYVSLDKTRQPTVILGLPFLPTANVQINCRSGTVDMTFGSQTLRIHAFSNSFWSLQFDDECFVADIIKGGVPNHTSSVVKNTTPEFAFVDDRVSEASDEEIDEEIACEEVNTIKGEKQLWSNHVEELPLHIDSHLKPSLNEAPKIQLKKLSSHLKYAYLGEGEILPVIISSTLEDDQERALLQVLMENKAAIGCTIADLKGIIPSIVIHKIITSPDSKPARDLQRRLNPNMREVVNNQVLKWLDAGIIYPISDSTWVSPTQTEPKKAGIQIVTNESGEQVATRPLTGWRVCIDYGKLNSATSKDHYALPFIDQIVEKLAGQKFYYFLDGYSGYNQITIQPEDQYKTTFTCPYSTFAFKRMPFGLCNSPAT
nr:RNA-directed DNA polymerase, eukaryota [Tanacetum cinerariifolium]